MHLRGWQRLGIALSIAWVAVASLLYFSQLGVVLKEGDSLPPWVAAWHSIPFTKHALLFALESPAACDFGSRGLDLCFQFLVTFSGTGYLVFILIPVTAIWLVGNCAAWIRRGFANTLS
jgi:hypothetical protein